MATQRMSLPAIQFPSFVSDCRGFLLKLDATSKSWKRRYCILAEACLYLYLDEESQKAIGKEKRFDLGITRFQLNLTFAFLQPLFVFMATAFRASAVWAEIDATPSSSSRRTHRRSNTSTSWPRRKRKKRGEKN